MISTPISTANALRTLENCEFHRSAKMPLPEHFTPGETYVKVHYRMDTASYRHNGYPGFQSGEDGLLFRDRIHAALAKYAGFRESDETCYAIRGNSPQERLYLHPDDLSGFVALESIQAVLRAIEGAEGSSLRWMDVYQLPETLDDEEIERRLTYYEPQIVEQLLATARTQRRNRFVMLSPHHAMSIAQRLPGLHFVAGNGSFEALHSVAESYLNKLISRLVEQGLLVRMIQDGHIYHRTAMKGEIKSIKRAERSDYWDLADQILSAA
ncbi:hypothetical protein [Marinimicrobium sp. ABcell2]|uniref:hypothetical protein n=1 Tax=Marinimicrobium sp. ABcell2 TaxID=3069751 RepID=UPI0027B56831|nr:hypothetical protein [Marinimicrobium sp. ABcell2]MDQ2077454.1 hypothetical protein [Marinimicrobium sp. ABcell2]